MHAMCTRFEQKSQVYIKVIPHGHVAEAPWQTCSSGTRGIYLGGKENQQEQKHNAACSILWPWLHLLLAMNREENRARLCSHMYNGSYPGTTVSARLKPYKFKVAKANSSKILWFQRLKSAQLEFTPFQMCCSTSNWDTNLAYLGSFCRSTASSALWVVHTMLPLLISRFSLFSSASASQKGRIHLLPSHHFVQKNIVSFRSCTLLWSRLDKLRQ